MLGSHLTAVPGSLLRVVERHGSSAVANASAAAGAISAAVRERGDLTRSLLHETATADGAGALSVLSDATCRELMGTRSVGRLAYIARRGVPDVVPVNYVLFDGDVLIRSGPGPKLQAAERQEPVAFEVDDLDEDGRSGWSVVVHGRASRPPWSELEHLDLVGAPWATGPRRQLIRITPRRLTGRRIHGSRGAPDSHGSQGPVRAPG